MTVASLLPLILPHLLVPEIDFGALPAVAAAPGYTFHIEIKLASGTTYRVNDVQAFATAEPRNVLSTVYVSLKQDERWSLRRVGLSLVLLGCKGSSVVGVNVEGTGSKPVVRWRHRGLHDK